MKTMKTLIVAAVTSTTFLLFGVPNPPTAQDPMIAITPVNRSMEQTGGTAAINTSGGGTWRASTSDNWILLTSSSGTAGYPVGYTVSANNNVETRIGYVYVSGYVHTITQAGLGATLGSYSAAFEREGGGGSVTVNAPSGKTWHAKSNVDWITVASSSGTGTRSLGFTVARYDEVSTRSGTLTIADNTFTVYQTGRRMQLTSYSATSDYFAERIKIRVNALADTTWGVSVDASWMTVTDAGNGRGGDVVQVALAENLSYNARNGIVTIGTEQFSVRQLGRTALVFKINPTEVSMFGVDGASGERIVVTATPDLGWTATSSADWIELYSGYASGSGNGNVVYKVKPNPTLYPRSGTITVTAADGGVATKRLEISQEAAVASLTVDGYEFEAAGESLTVGVNTGSIVGWNVINSVDWLSVSGLSMVGPANVTLTAAANTSVQPRSGTIRIADHDFRVSQKGRGVSVSYDETKIFDTDGKTTGENVDNNVITVTADADVEWTAVASDPTWIVIYEGMSGRGDGTVKYIVAPYVGSGEIRTGMITIGSEIVYVTQRPYELSIEPNGQWVDGNSGAGEIQVALDVDGVWNAIATEPWIVLDKTYNAGTGSGKVLFAYTDNATGKARTGKIVIAGEIYTLTQAARQLVAVGAGAEGHGGHVSGGGSYNVGSEVELVATADDGYAFSHWALPGGGTTNGNPLVFAATSATTLQAVFTPLAPTLAVAAASLKGVKLCWTNLAWATQYKVWRGTSSNRGQATEIATLTNDGICEYLDASGAENQSYWYWIEAVGVEDDMWSNGVQGRREKKTFSITYANLRGMTHANPATYREGSTVTFSAPSSRRGYTFAGWSPSQIAADTSGDVTVRAIWIQNEYSVRFDLNGANGAMADERYTYGLWKYLTPTNFTRTGYVFAGWSADGAQATAAEYGDAESLKNLTTELNGIVTLYAIWRGENAGSDPIPIIGGDGDVAAALAGSADSRLAEYVKTAADYNAYRGWVEAKGLDHRTVKDSPRAWLSYALDASGLISRTFRDGDLSIVSLTSSDGAAFSFEVNVAGVAIGAGATAANLARVFSIGGSDILDENAFSTSSMNVSLGVSANGNLSVAATPRYSSASFFFRVRMRVEANDDGWPEVVPLDYCVIDLSAGANAANYPVVYMGTPPSGGFNVDEYKTTKLALRLIAPGWFAMCGQYGVTLEKPFYCGVFEVTQKQYELVTGSNPSQYKGDMRPVEKVSWNMIRGDSSIYDWPGSANVDPSSFIGKIQARTGLNFDLPTEAQWEYACRAGTTTSYNNGSDVKGALMSLGRYNGNQADGNGGYTEHTTVGSYQPNAWGLYDMHGNIWERCLDWYGDLSGGVTDPVGPISGTYRVERGGGWSSYADRSTSFIRYYASPSLTFNYLGFRLVRTLSD